MMEMQPGEGINLPKQLLNRVSTMAIRAGASPILIMTMMAIWIYWSSIPIDRPHPIPSKMSCFIKMIWTMKVIG